MWELSGSGWYTRRWLGESKPSPFKITKHILISSDLEGNGAGYDLNQCFPTWGLRPTGGQIKNGLAQINI